MARDTKEHKALVVDDEGDDDTHNMGMVRLAARKAEKKTRQKAQKAEAKEATVEEDKEDVEVITINQVTTKKKWETARSIVWCLVIQRFIQKRRANHEPLNLEVETLHGIQIVNDDGEVRRAKVPILKKDKIKVVENNNCPDTGASISLAGSSLMKKMGVTQD